MEDVFKNVKDAPFKIGDLVERSYDNHGGLKVGDSSTVVGFRLEHGKVYRILLDRCHTYGHQPTRLKLIKAKEEIINTYEIY